MCEQAYERHDQSHDGSEGCEREDAGEGGERLRVRLRCCSEGTQISRQLPLFVIQSLLQVFFFLGPGVSERRDKQEPH